MDEQICLGESNGFKHLDPQTLNPFRFIPGSLQLGRDFWLQARSIDLDISKISATKLSFLGLDKIETYCSPFLRCFPLQRMENPSYQNSKPMCQCVFLDFKSGCLKIHGRTNLEPKFSPRFHSLEYLEFLWRHQFAKFFAIHDPSRHLTMKSSRLHGIWRSTNRAWVAWVMTQLMDVTALLTTRGYSATVWCFRNPKKNNHLTCMKLWQKNGIFTISTSLSKRDCYQHMNLSCIQGAAWKPKNPEKRHLTKSIYLHVLKCFSTLKIAVFFRKEPQLSNGKSAKTDIHQSLHVTKKMRQGPRGGCVLCTTEKRYQGCFWVTSKTKISELVVETTPFEKICASQNGFIFPKEGWK